MIAVEYNDYAESFSTAESVILQRINRETNLQMPYPRMLSGHLQGLFLKMVSHMIRPRRILEVGSFTGYSAVCLADGLTEDGQLHTIEYNSELEDLLTRNFNEAGLKGKVILHIGDARNIIPEINETFDLVFLDADKENYPDYYDMLMAKINFGGYLLADNVLWGGKVLKDPPEGDRETMGITAFNKKVRDDKGVEQMLLPLRDGIMIIRKL